MNAIGCNEVELDGTARSVPAFSHENHGVRFFRFILQVPRLSGQADLLPILIPEALVPQIHPEAILHLRGQLRSFNNKSGQGSRLVLSIHAQSLSLGNGDPVNRIFLSGTLCKPPILRKTPLGRSICDLILAVPRRYGRADYLPVIAWGQLATTAGQCHVGDALHLEGRIQSRIYTKKTDTGAAEHTAYEVSVMHLLDCCPNDPASC